MAITKELALEAIGSVQEPIVKKSLKELNAVREVDVTDDGTVRAIIDVFSFGKQTKDALEASIKKAAMQAGAKTLELKLEQRTLARDLQEGDPIEDAANVIVVMSGKGGVGKSTTAVNMAVSLAKMGAKVGLLDADMYGPSVPTMVGTEEHPSSTDGKTLDPVERYGVKLMSLGFLLEDPKEAVVWRGPMLHGALMQFLQDVNWGKLDYLFLDLPPGTGDIPLTLSQKLQVTGAVIVTTPQNVALQDVFKTVSMCEKVNIPVLGVVENESYFVCDQCEKKHFIFGEGGGDEVAEMAKAEVIARVPLDTVCRKAGDAGEPVVLSFPDSPSGAALFDAAEKLSQNVTKHHVERGATKVTIDRSGGKNRHLPLIKVHGRQN